jgi:hypothetical protein
MTTYNEATTASGHKRLVEQGTLDELAATYANKRVVREQYDHLLNNARKEEDEAQARLFDALEAQGLRAIRTPLGLFSLNDLPWAQVLDPVAAREWAEENMPELITLNIQRLSPFIRPFIKSGEELPPGVTFTVSRRITWRRE